EPPAGDGLHEGTEEEQRVGNRIFIIVIQALVNLLVCHDSRLLTGAPFHHLSLPATFSYFYTSSFTTSSSSSSHTEHFTKCVRIDRNRPGPGQPALVWYVMGIGEAEAFSERLKRELLALEAANVHSLMESESIIEEVLLI
ncbi:hypothetical protein BHM03_00026412, partial [Ensete ventricosum]